MNRRTAVLPVLAASLALVGAALGPAQAAPVPGDRTAEVTAMNDWDGDGRGDLAALTADGRVLVYRSTGTRLAAGQLVASGLRGYDWARLAGDVDEDGHADVLARSGSGRLLLLRGSASGTLAGVTVIAGDWSSYEQIVPIDYDVDGVVDLVGLDLDPVPQMRAGNFLRVYTGEAGVTFRAGTYIPLSDQTFAALTAWGDGDQDGYQEVVVLDVSTGRLFALETRGDDGLFQTRTQHRVIGTGWNGFTAITSTGDFDGDGNPDVVARTQAGSLLLYRSDDQGRLSRPTTIGTGWAGLAIG